MPRPDPNPKAFVSGQHPVGRLDSPRLSVRVLRECRLWLAYCEPGRGEHAELGVGTVVAATVGDDAPGFEEAGELLGGKAFVTQPRVERVDPCVLPG